jgi:mRNA interferase MazF
LVGWGPWPTPRAGDEARGRLVTVVLPGAYGKPRPALVIQSDLFDEHPSVTILPITGARRASALFRIDVLPSVANGLHKPSQVMVDKAQGMPRDRLEDTIGGLEDHALLLVTRALAVFLGIAWGGFWRA